MTLKDRLSNTLTAGRKLLGLDAPVVPVVRLEGMIASGSRGNTLNLARIEKLLDKAFAMSRAPAVALVINSPGGSPVQSRLIHDRIRHLAETKEKPVLVFCEDVAASGGYILACAGDEIFCDASSILGSIGVVSASFGFTSAMEKLGVERRLKTAGANKSLGDPFSPETKDQTKRLERIMGKLHTHFIDLVKARRGDRLGDDPDLFTGAVYTGDEAVANGLVDGLADIRIELKKRFGDKVVLRPLAPPSRLGLGRFMGRAAASTITELESRSLWSRYGL